jgi:tRNA threonylcarbamoyladenosine biosynthesis protein TsaB
MLVLALDTTMRGGSCALALGGVVRREAAGDASRTQAERLPADLMALLDAEAVALTDVDVFAVTTGPGSFTGLRVGIATMQGLAFGEGKPLVGVSTFDALAAIASDAGAARTATWIDAWRGDVFAALYENGREIEAPTVAAPDALLRRLAGQSACFIGDGAASYSELIARHMGDRGRIAEPPAPAIAGTAALLAAARAQAGEAPPPHAIRPLYVRRSDAELARQNRDARVTR